MLAHAAMCRRRRLDYNRISVISNGTFAGLRALAGLYDAGLGAGRCYLLAALSLRCRVWSGACVRPALSSPQRGERGERIDETD